MYSETVERGKEPTKFQLKRLRDYELTLRLNSVLYEGFDLGTDIAFMLVLFHQSGQITLPSAWNWYTASTACPNALQTSGDTNLYQGLAIASAFFIGASLTYRLFASVYAIATKNKEISGLEWLWVSWGIFVSMLDPWNGALLINQVMEKKRLERDDYILAISEFKNDIILLVFENLPQAVIQIIYGVYTGGIGLTSVAWYPAVFMTAFHLLSQLNEIHFLWKQLPELFLAHERIKNSSAIVAPESA